MSSVKAAAIQMSCTERPEDNIAHAEELVRKAYELGARIILLPELFERPYFCQERRYEYYDYALPTEENPAVLRFRKLTEELSLACELLRKSRKRSLQFHRDAGFGNSYGGIQKDPYSG